MSEKMKPILFSTPMVSAILDGKKTQTRRIVKVQTDDRGLRWANSFTGWEDWHGRPVKCPYGAIGTTLWVREIFCKGIVIDDNENRIGPEEYYYKTHCKLPDWYRPDLADDHPNYLSPKWKSPIHMPFDACRIFLRITDIQVERLQDISEDDAISEGVINRGPMGFTVFGTDQSRFAKDAFQFLWEKINGADSWAANPFVWKISFERIEKPE